MDHDRKCDCLATRPSAWLNEGSNNLNASEELLVPLGLDDKVVSRLTCDLAQGLVLGQNQVPANLLSDFEFELELLAREKKTKLAEGGARQEAGEIASPFGANSMAGAKGSSAVRKYVVSQSFWKEVVAFELFKISSETCTYKYSFHKEERALKQNGNAVLTALKTGGGSMCAIKRPSSHESEALVASVQFTDEFADRSRQYVHGAVLVTEGGPAMVLLANEDTAELRLLKSKARVASMTSKRSFGRHRFDIEVSCLSERDAALIVMLLIIAHERAKEVFAPDY
mmetsp:Transcript_2718/g.5976  ORF Transcript_2718/g.5976 Transcript_2718/m.5976 type:complete len:284 (-) Transcript_2718:793-1644(-)|eukprot:CAMPEP_0185857572 /NCGR_PEP_ID=MMETSP1354-20130828/29572_1 /TAXON_ID=708628 /ORGANISM="Erythrolobus madagascarensis, Strain CCMP3276" /LENGTH=283 /DNA_ID=CAMNT_0028559843 /DNA_START=33 /DNA_END=884 /DNA_ORIENTATION=-